METIIGRTKCGRRAVTLVEVVFVLLILMVLVMVMLPALQSNRGVGSRTQCINRMKQIGLGVENYAATYTDYPSSGTISKEATGDRVGGWSLLVKLLPYTEYAPLYKTLNMKGDPVQLLATNDPATITANNTLIRDFICPSNRNASYLHPKNNPPTDSFTNFKVVSATTEASLAMCVDPSLKPPYGDAKQHPDGALYPGNGTPINELKIDGLSHTIMLMETVDDQYSRWIVGAEASLVGLPPSINKTLAYDKEKRPYYCPDMFDGTFGDASPVARSGLRTFFDYDFSTAGIDRGAYAKAGDPGWDTSIPNTNMYGPSSGHPNAIVVGFADSSAIALSKKIDAACLFFLITRTGSDPFNIP